MFCEELRKDNDAKISIFIAKITLLIPNVKFDNIEILQNKIIR